MWQMRNYPVGQQDFKEIRTAGKLYIDKTEYVWRMTHGDSKYMFLSRPRRFGKTLLTSTLQYYFEGHKELFEGLAIDRLETEWEDYPVLRFDMSRAKKRTREEVRSELNLQLVKYEAVYGKGTEETMPNQRFAGVIERACGKTGKQVVVLIDEYDAPLLEVVNDNGALGEIRDEMRYFYSTLKSMDSCLRFVFLTGITKFSQLSLFSGLNNISDISMLKDYAAICGITKTEMREQMMLDIETLAKRLTLTEEETWKQLVDNYDGYHFTWPSDDIFNPYSLLRSFSEGEMDNYWFGSGTSKPLVELIRKYELNPTDIGVRMAKKDDFNVPLENARTYVPLFYQSGYLTIKGYDANSRTYTLDVPNREVEEGLLNNLLTSYMTGEMALSKTETEVGIRRALLNDDIDGALTAIQELLWLVPYADNTNYEGHYQEMMACLFVLAGAEVSLEDRTRNGRVDIVVRTKSRLYVIELKLNKSVDKAKKQIIAKKYPRKFDNCQLPVVTVAVNFDSEDRNITGWEVI